MRQKCEGWWILHTFLDFVLTPGNVDDRKPLTGTNLMSRIYGKLFGDK